MTILARDAAVNQPATPAGTRAPLRRTLAITRPASRRLGITVLLGAASMGAAIGLLASSAWLLSRAAEHPSIAYLGLAIAFVRFFAIARGLFRYFERLVGHDAAFRLLGDLRVHSYERLEPLAPGGLSAFRSGDLLARLVGDIESLQDLVVRVVPPFAIALIVGGATVIFATWVLPAAGVVLAVTLCVAATVVPLLTRSLARKTEARNSALRGELSCAVVDLVEGADELAVNGATESQLDRVREADAALTRASKASARTSGVGAGLTALLMGLAIIGAVVVGVPAVHAGRLDGVLLATIVLLPLAAFEVVAGLPGASQSLERVRASAARVFSMLDAEPLVTDPAAPAPAPEPPSALRLHDVQVGYETSGPPALEGIDLDLGPGRRVGLLGPSGAGKSTLAHALLGFLPYEGSITLSGVEIRDLEGEDLRHRVGLVAQDAHVFDTTVRENLRLGRRDASDEEAYEALARVRLADTIRALPLGLDTWVGANGATLSGGQRQRLVVARALLARFPVLVLDEPAEHLDAAAADALTADLLGVTQSQTTLLITHRFFGLDAMDEIVVLDEGRVVERGTHQELRAAGSWYAQMYEREQNALLRVLEGEAR